MSLVWYTADTASSELNIKVSDKGLAAAREQCLRIKGLPLDTEVPPSESFAQGVVYQALANKQSTQADVGDEYGTATNGVRLYPMDRKIQALLIVPLESTGYEWVDGYYVPNDEPRDGGFVRSLVG